MITKCISGNQAGERPVTGDKVPVKMIGSGARTERLDLTTWVFSPLHILTCSCAFT